MTTVRLLPALLLGLALALSPSGIAAQEGVPTHSVVRFFKCSPQVEAVAAFQRARPIVEEMVEEGKFLDYGILTHAWGDEWNVVDYFIVSGIQDFFTHFGELAARIAERHPEFMSEATRLCTEHRDVIYSVVLPPGGG